MSAGKAGPHEDRELVEIVEGLLMLLGWQQELVQRALRRLAGGTGRRRPRSPHPSRRKR